MLDQKINFLSTPFDHDSIDLLQDLNIPFFKIPSILISLLHISLFLFPGFSFPLFWILCSLIPCFYLGKDFEVNAKHHTLSQAQIVFKKNIRHKLGNVSYEVKYDQKLINLILSKKFGFISKFIPDFFKKRIFVITCQIGSDYSIYSAIIRKEDQKLNVIENKGNKEKIKTEISKQIKILGNEFNFLSLNFFSKLGNFGRGYHLGASIPMLDENKSNINETKFLHTKKNGEITKYKNVFIIDSSNFTNIPSGSLSLTIMANALRIGAESIND